MHRASWFNGLELNQIDNTNLRAVSTVPGLFRHGTQLEGSSDLGTRGTSPVAESAWSGPVSCTTILASYFSTSSSSSQVVVATLSDPWYYLAM